MKRLQTLYFFAPMGVRSIEVSVSVCLSVRISRKYKSKCNQIFCTCYPRPKLGHPLTILCLLPRFVDDIMFSQNVHRMCQNQTMRMFRPVRHVTFLCQLNGEYSLH